VTEDDVAAPATGRVGDPMATGAAVPMATGSTMVGMPVATDGAPEPLLNFAAQQTRWGGGWRRFVFPAVFLVYLGQTAHGLSVHSAGAELVVGAVLLGAFCVGYLVAISLTFGGARRPFWAIWTALLALMLAELAFAHEDAFVMGTYLAVLILAAGTRHGRPVVIALVVAALAVPPAVPSWDTGPDWGAALSIVLVSLAMYGFFAVIRSNRALAEARGQLARLAAENERTRIARDLHDLLGHSLTTITLKAGLAHRVAAQDPARALAEVAEVEELSRRALADVRAAVASYREVTLTGELASGRELLRAAGVDAQFPSATDVVRPEHHELFGWVVREALTNVVRHARATRCRVDLGPDHVEVVDDGIGGGGPGAAALRGLRERVAAAGATLTFGPAPGRGWRVLVEAPASPASPVPPDDAPAPAIDLPAARP
jgi:two-component system, NarL family, sensor histidine kinase DesK